jgi:hypothetical protein
LNFEIHFALTLGKGLSDNRQWHSERESASTCEVIDQYGGEASFLSKTEWNLNNCWNPVEDES